MPTPNPPLNGHSHPTGKPLAIRHEGRIWIVDPATDYQHWFTRDA